MPVRKTRPRVVLCAAITADGKLAGDLALPESEFKFFAPQPGDVLLTDTPGDLWARLREMRKQGDARRILCFGGAALFRRLLEAGLIDELGLVVCPRIDGRHRAATFSAGPGDFFPASIRCRLLKMEVRGDRCFLHYRVLRPRTGTPAAERPV